MELETETEILERTIKTAKNLLEFEFCNISLVKDDKLVFKISTSGEHVPIPLGKGIVGKTFKEDKSIIIDNFENYSDVEPEHDNYKSGLSIPIKKLGVFQTISKERATFSQDDLELAELLILIQLQL